MVDDEEDIRATLSETLEHIGFTVTEAATADDAIELIRQRKEPFSLLLSDIVMPGKNNGVDLAQFTREHSPDTRVILASGYAENVSVERALNVACELLKKPFGRQALLNKLTKWSWK